MADLDLSWDAVNWNGDQGHYDIKRGTSSGSYTEVDTVPAGTTTYTDTGLNDGETYYYVVEADNSAGGSGNSNEDNDTTTIPAPSSVTATVDANDQISLSWNDNSTGENNFRVEISRDGASYVSPSGGPTTPGANTTSATYGPNSDQSYDSQVGIDSSFQFRVRAEGSDANSSWSYSSTVYTDPIPPHNPSVSRPDANTFQFDAETKTDIGSHIVIRAREDQGSGYGNWAWLETISYGNLPYTMSVGEGQSITLQEDSRYQFKFQTYNNSDPNDRRSEYVYADYGNDGNVYFEDDFNDGSLSAWDSVTQDASARNSGLNDAGVSGPDEGQYYILLDSGGEIVKNLGNLSGESDVIVKCAMAAGSLDSSSERALGYWYDGSSWQAINIHRWEYNKQGWVEAQYLIPDSWLSTDNRIRFNQFGGGGDYTLIDRVVVSDILHEYTKPADPSNYSLDASIEDEITGSWTRNDAFGNDGYYYLDETNTGNRAATISFGSTSTTETATGLKDGEEYNCQLYIRRTQPRRGQAASSAWLSSTLSQIATTILPAPTSLAASNIGPDSADLAWTNNHDNGSVAVQYKESDAGSWTEDASGLSLSTESHTLTGLLDGELYDARVLAETEHTTTVDS